MLHLNERYRIGNSNKGPITNVKAIKGWSGNAVIAIAKAIGEFLAKVLKLKLVLLEFGNLISCPITKHYSKRDFF